MVDTAVPRPIWRLNPACRLHWRHLDGEWLVYETASGLTHQLDGIAACTLMCFESDALDLDSLLNLAARLLDTPLDDTLAGHVSVAVRQFRALGMLLVRTPA
jgi:hypothetical protein